jgi:hypothetical protein
VLTEHGYRLLAGFLQTAGLAAAAVSQEAADAADAVGTAEAADAVDAAEIAARYEPLPRAGGQRPPEWPLPEWPLPAGAQPVVR